MVENEARAGHFVVGLDVQACSAAQLIKSVARNIESISSGFQLCGVQTKGDRSRARAGTFFGQICSLTPALVLNPSLCCDARGWTYRKLSQISNKGAETMIEMSPGNGLILCPEVSRYLFDESSERSYLLRP